MGEWVSMYVCVFKFRSKLFAIHFAQILLEKH